MRDAGLHAILKHGLRLRNVTGWRRAHAGTGIDGLTHYKVAIGQK